MGLGGVLGRHRDRHGSTRDPQNCLFGHPEIANFEWVWGSLWAGIGTATQPTHPPINLTAQLLKRGGGSARQRNWIEKSTAVFCASASLPGRKKPNDQTTERPSNHTNWPGGRREAIKQHISSLGCACRGRRRKAQPKQPIPGGPAALPGPPVRPHGPPHASWGGLPGPPAALPGRLFGMVNIFWALRAKSYIYIYM